MKHLNETERILTVFGAILIIGALALSITTEVSARRRLAEYKAMTAAQTITLQATAPAFTRPLSRYVGYDQQTLAGRWSIPDGHATLGLSFAAFGLLLVAAPRAAARKRASQT